MHSTGVQVQTKHDFTMSGTLTTADNVVQAVAGYS